MMNSSEDGSLFTLETQPPFPLALALWVEDAPICVLGPALHGCRRVVVSVLRLLPDVTVLR